MTHDGARMRRVSRKSVGCRENRSGCRIRAGAGTSLACHRCRGPLSGGRRNFHRLCRPWTPMNPDPAACGHLPAAPPALPPAPPAAAARRHGFSRSHGPTEHKVNAPWLTFRCPKTRAPGSPPATACEVENAEGTRDPQKSWPWPLPSRRGPRGRRRIWPRPARSDAVEATEGTQEPQESSTNTSMPSPACSCFQPAREPPHGPGGLPCLLANPASDGHARTSRKNRRNRRPAGILENPGSSRDGRTRRRVQTQRRCRAWHDERLSLRGAAIWSAIAGTDAPWAGHREAKR
jgi:hypothetical protein